MQFRLEHLDFVDCRPRSENDHTKSWHFECFLPTQWSLPPWPSISLTRLVSKYFFTIQILPFLLDCRALDCFIEYHLPTKTSCRLDLFKDVESLRTSTFLDSPVDHFYTKTSLFTLISKDNIGLMIFFCDNRSTVSRWAWCNMYD